jgi:transglutaminase-like putative cysteine protease
MFVSWACRHGTASRPIESEARPSHAPTLPRPVIGGTAFRSDPMRPTRTQALIRIDLQVDLNYEVAAPGADFVFNVHAAHTPSQSLSAERLVLTPAVASQTHTDPATGNRYLRVHAAPGPLALSYAVTVDLMHRRSDPAQLEEVPIDRLPPEVLGYLYPSRYCQSDRLLTLAASAFGTLKPGYGRVQAIRDWVERHVKFTSRSSDSNTSALDTLIDRVGVCRDFAHLMIALCRAMNIPARYATGTDYGADPALGPPDFQAYGEVYLGGGWYIFDPSGTAMPMGFVRFGTGRDAADVAFATIFGSVRSHRPTVRALAVEDEAQGWVRPHHCTDALSTDGGPAPASGR